MMSFSYNKTYKTNRPDVNKQDTDRNSQGKKQCTYKQDTTYIWNRHFINMQIGRNSITWIQTCDVNWKDVSTSRRRYWSKVSRLSRMMTKMVTWQLLYYDNQVLLLCCVWVVVLSVMLPRFRPSPTAGRASEAGAARCARWRLRRTAWAAV